MTDAGRCVRQVDGTGLELVDAVDRAVRDLFAAHAARPGASPADPETLYAVSLALREAVTNAVRHGGGGDPDRPVEVVLEIDGGQFTARLSDHGPGFDPEACPDPLLPEGRLRPGGRGLFLMRHHMDSVEYTFPPAGGTVLTLRRALAADRAASSRTPTEGNP